MTSPGAACHIVLQVPRRHVEVLYQIPRKSFARIAVDAYEIPLVNPATPACIDVPTSDPYYQYIKAVTASGLTEGVGSDSFGPDGTLARQQLAAIVVRWVAARNGHDLSTMYTSSDLTALLGAFPDAGIVSPSLAREMTFAIDFGILWGDADSSLRPMTTATRIDAASMIIHSLGVPPSP